MGATTQIITFKDSRVTGSCLSRTPQETAHKDSDALQGSSDPGKVPHPSSSSWEQPGTTPTSQVSAEMAGVGIPV